MHKSINQKVRVEVYIVMMTMNYQNANQITRHLCNTPPFQVINNAIRC